LNSGKLSEGRLIFSGFDAIRYPYPMNKKEYIKLWLEKADGEAANGTGENGEFSKPKPFKVRKFSLGEEVHVDRDELYSDSTSLA